MRRCHDVCVGLFRGMAAAMVDRANPHMIGLETKYQANGRVVNSALVAAVAGGFCYTPWWTLATVALVIPSVYVGYRFNAPTETTTVVESDRSAVGVRLPPGLAIASLRMLPCAATEDTEKLLVRLMPVLISVLQVALELRDTARDKAASSLKVITTLEACTDRQGARSKQHRLAMKKLLTDKHFMTLAANQQASGQMLVGRKETDYDQLAKLFLWVGECANLDKTLLDNIELPVWLLNEMLKTWISLSPEAFNDRLNALLAEDRTDVIRQFTIDILGDDVSPAGSESLHSPRVCPTNRPAAKLYPVGNIGS